MSVIGKLTIVFGVLALLGSLTFYTTRADDKVVAVKRSDPVSLSSLQVLVQQQASDIQTLMAELLLQQNRITDMETENDVLKREVDALKNKSAEAVAFTVRFSRDNVSHGITIGLHSIVRFDRVDFNTGNGYDPHSGIFTAPVAGIYSFFLTQMGVYDQGYPLLSIVKDGTTLDIVYSKNHEDQGSSQVVTHLRTGEQVWVQHQMGHAVRGKWFTDFTGYLLHAD